MNNFDYLALFEEVRKLRRRSIEAGESGSSPAIDLLLRRLRGAVEHDEVAAILNLLSFEYGYEFDDVGKEWAMRKLVHLEPRHFYPHTALAEFLWFNRTDMGEAIELGRRGVELSEEDGSFSIHALDVLARIARKARDWALFGWCLTHLMEGFGRRGGPDIGYERDFMKWLPPSAPDKPLYAEFNEFVGRRQALRGEEQVHRSLRDLQKLEWSAASDEGHIVEQHELLLLERCRMLLGAELPPPDAENWRDVLRELVGESRRYVSVAGQILASFQRDVVTMGKQEARARAYEAIGAIKGEDLRRMAKKAVVLLNRTRGEPH
ncbi:hypothetical protein [Iodidimonas sp. SYSU 1G8]|uniref:hypothetical protein n=1 Tax=Iodidimonas sp. SYSU 1G8 TaxID=3133967 RepID=UPI0031FEE6F2